MAKLLRAKVIEKTQLFRLRKKNIQPILPTRNVQSNPPTLLDLKSTDIGKKI